MAKFKFYNTRLWRDKVRPQVFRRDEGLCQQCHRREIIRAGTEVHHKIAVNDDNCNDWNIIYNLDNLELLCWECHELTKTKSTLINFITPPGS